MEMATMRINVNLFGIRFDPIVVRALFRELDLRRCYLTGHKVEEGSEKLVLVGEVDRILPIRLCVKVDFYQVLWKF